MKKETAFCQLDDAKYFENFGPLSLFYRFKTSSEKKSIIIITIMIKNTPDEEEKEQAFYEATDEFLIPDVQRIIWECFLARCACGKCGGIPTYNENVIVTTPRGPILMRHLKTKDDGRAFAKACGTDSFHSALAKNGEKHLTMLKNAKESAAFQDMATTV